MTDYDKLLRRGQLYNGEHIPERLSTWSRVPLDDWLWLERGPKSLLFREAIRRLWPEALLEPINPHVKAPPKFRLPRFARGLQRRVRRLLG